MGKIPNSFIKTFDTNAITYFAFELINEPNYIVDCNNQTKDGNGICCHLLHIHSSNVVIKKLIFKNDKTEIIRKLKRSEIKFPKTKR